MQPHLIPCTLGYITGMGQILYKRTTCTWKVGKAWRLSEAPSDLSSLYKSTLKGDVFLAKSFQMLAKHIKDHSRLSYYIYCLRSSTTRAITNGRTCGLTPAH